MSDQEIVNEIARRGNEINEGIRIATWFGVAVAFIGAILAFIVVLKQNRLIGLQSKIQLFEDRYKVYEATRLFVVACFNDSLTQEKLDSFKREVDKSFFLFEQPLRDFLYKIHFDAETLTKARSVLINLGERKESACNEFELKTLDESHNKIQAILPWFKGVESALLKHEFSKYLDLSKIQ